MNRLAIATLATVALGLAAIADAHVDTIRGTAGPPTVLKLINRAGGDVLIAESSAPGAKDTVRMNPGKVIQCTGHALGWDDLYGLAILEAMSCTAM